jgi:serine/threonine protein kinase
MLNRMTDSSSDDDTLESDTPCEDKPKIDFGKVPLLLGEGSYGVVKLASYNNNKVAVKILECGQPHSTEFDECEDEKNIMQKLKDLKVPNVVQLHGYDVKIPNYFIVMDYMSHGSLDDNIKSADPFAWSKRYNIIYDIAVAVKYLHKHGMLHRDIKGANILLDANDNAKLSDFGATKDIHYDDGYIFGTAPYIAPEVMDHQYSEKSDIYALIMTLWQLAAWKLPYDTKGLDDMHLLKQVYEGKRETIPKDCPPKIAKLITWGWQQNPKQRPSARKLVHELKTDIDVMPDKLKDLDLDKARSVSHKRRCNIM